MLLRDGHLLDSFWKLRRRWRFYYSNARREQNEGIHEGENSTANRGIDFATAAKRAVQLADVAQQDKPGHGRLDTGIGSVDALWKGLWPGQLYYVMARSRTGKTPFMMQLARNVAETLLAEAEITQKPPGHVHIFSLEMTANDLLTVNLASVTQVLRRRHPFGKHRPGAR